MLFIFVPYAFRQGTTSHDSYSEDVYGKLLERYQLLDQEMSVVAVEWLECERRIDNYVDEQVGNAHVSPASLSKHNRPSRHVWYAHPK